MAASANMLAKAAAPKPRAPRAKNWRRVSLRTASIFRSPLHLFNTSSRFSTWFASMVMAASSAAFTIRIRFDSPT